LRTRRSWNSSIVPRPNRPWSGEALRPVERLDAGRAVGLRETGNQQHRDTDDSYAFARAAGSFLAELPLL
jgi:hypothetical protein